MTLARRSRSPRRAERLTEQLAQAGHFTLPVAALFTAGQSTRGTRGKDSLTARASSTKAKG